MTTTPDAREALGERVFAAMTQTTEIFSMHLGLELGLYQALRTAGRATSTELATASGVHERYTREWLEQQAVAGIVGASGADASSRVYHLPEPHAEALLDEDSPYYIAGGPATLAGIALALPALPDAYRTGGGVAYADYGPTMRRGIAAFNRPLFQHELGSAIIPAIPEVHRRLTEPPARVLDLGCGIGASSIALARAYPGVQVVGVDLDEASVTEAAAAAAAEGLADRVTFHAGDAAQLRSEDGSFDIVTIFEALHDMGDPVGALRTAGGLLAPGGSIVVADERAAEDFHAPGDDLERFFYGFSVLHCLPATMAEKPVEANGTVIRPDTVRRWGHDAGFSRVAELDIDNPFWRFYRLAR